MKTEIYVADPPKPTPPPPQSKLMAEADKLWHELTEDEGPEGFAIRIILTRGPQESRL